MFIERRIQDNFVQHCFADIEASTRCRTYKDIKSIYDIELDLQRDIHSSLTPQNLSIEICVQKFFSIHIYVKIALTKKKKKKKKKNFTC